MVIALCVMTFWSAHTSAAKGFGVTAGASFLGLKDISVDATTGYHAGLTYQFDLPFGFSIQPALLYHMKSSVIEEAYTNGSRLDFKTGYLELPLSVQWGPDLILFRPFLDVTPFVGYGLTNNIAENVSNDKWDGLNRLEYGLGVGLGLDVWKLQVIGRYNWNFGSLINTEGNLPSGSDIQENVKSSLFDGKNYGGVTLTVALKF